MISFNIYPNGSIDIIQDNLVISLLPDEAEELVRDWVLQRGFRLLVSLIVAYLTGRKAV